MPFGADGSTRIRAEQLCALVVIGVNERKKRFLAIELYGNRLARGLVEAEVGIVPKLAIGDGAIGPHWRKSIPRHVCWMHKVNVLNCLPKSVQAKAKQALRQAETKADAEKAFDLFIETYEPISESHTLPACWPFTTFRPSTGRASERSH